MTVFAGHYGSVEFKRIGSSATLDCYIHAADIDQERKRFALGLENGIDIPFGTIVTGDRVRITTSDARGLPFRWYKNAANTVYVDNPTAGNLPLEFYANVDRMGNIRMYRTFASALANAGNNFLAMPLDQTEGQAPWRVEVNLLPGSFNSLGLVQGFQITTDRESVDTTALGNKYKNFSASAISGSGSVDCLFDFKNLSGDEMPLALSQLIQKIEVGSKFEGRFYILEPLNPQPPGYTLTEGVYYEVEGMLVSSAMTVRADQLVECSFDFITSGEFALRVGDAPVDLITEDAVNMVDEATLEELGVLIEEN